MEIFNFDFIENGAQKEEIKKGEIGGIEQKTVTEYLNKTEYDPFPNKPWAKEWQQVLYVAAHTMDSELYNMLCKLRAAGIEIRRQVNNKLVSYGIFPGEVSQDEFKGVIVPQFLEPNRDKIKSVLKLAAFEGKFIDLSDPQLHGINFNVDKEVVAGAIKKYLPRLIEAKYGEYSQGVRLDDGREIWVVCEREPGSDKTELLWEEFYVLCWLQDIGKIAPGSEGMAGAVRWREV